MRIAVDALGGDRAPGAVVAGALRALAEDEALSVVLVGPPAAIRPHLGESAPALEAAGRLVLHPARERIDPEEEPVKAVRAKPESTLVQAVRLVRDGAADAAVSAGSTGALLAAGLFALGRLPGVLRPALAPVLPTAGGRGVMVVDVGASADARPEHLRQHALLAVRYAEAVLGWERPSVGLLNVGAEKTKGNALAKAAYALLEAAPIRFVGNVEARDVLFGAADIVVTDGFTGNVFLKATEGAAAFVLALLKDAFRSGLRAKLGAMFLLPELRALKDRLDYAAYGGTPLLGLRRPLIKAHGASGPEAIAQAIAVAKSAAGIAFAAALGREEDGADAGEGRAAEEETGAGDAEGEPGDGSGP
ncbi:phosphate acyltransferase PlsX [Hydrogenibacillus schlegelii]|uniref:phosphate acyltransferase PlsX n=1 Tax=Hydrogenibacillus schlegelii TaxID=1484 RepID=UPI00082571E6|nr:phosphate acyltransferase PlsX [Hydrogenibacillus schlegelii]